MKKALILDISGLNWYDKLYVLDVLGDRYPGYPKPATNILRHEDLNFLCVNFKEEPRIGYNPTADIFVNAGHTPIKITL